MSRFLYSIIAIVVSAMAVTPVAAQTIVARFEVANVVFSPDGDGIEDTTSVSMTLGLDALSVSAVVFEADSITPVDTLLAPAPRGTGRTVFGWNGRYGNGAPAPDGAYLVTLYAAAAAGDTTITRRVFVDTVAPSLRVDSVTPNPYGPGVTGSPSELSIAFTVIGTSPLYTGIPRDEIQWRFIKPGNTELVPDSIRFEPAFIGADGSYELRWRAANQPALADGEYLVTLTAVDQGGHASSSEHSFVVDAKAPVVKIVEPTNNRSFRVAPESLVGWARDLTGIDSLDVRYSAGGPLVPVVVERVSGDTTFFHATLADSLVDEGTYTLTARAVDGVKRVGTAALTVTIDRTAPAPPELDPFEGQVHASTFRVTGTFPTGSTAGSTVRIYRGSMVVDSLFTFTVDTIDRVIALTPGRNVITATFVDGAFNESPPSNAVVVVFDDGSGLFVSAPMRPGDSFDVNLSRPGRGVTLRIYDMTGDLVAVLEDSGETANYTLRWDGRNGSGALVKRGPLVAVASIVMADGEKDTIRELFLFDPDTK